MQAQLITTSDGSHSLFVSHFNESYHSIHGAIQEARHVYIDAGFRACQNKEINLFEVGFGTGLNAFLTLLETYKTNTQVHYTSLELYPLDIEKIKELNYTEKLTHDSAGASLFYALHNAPWNEAVEITPNFTLHKMRIDFSNPDNLSTTDLFDLIYFDAFAPNKQPELWTRQIFDKLFAICNPDATIVTYCVKGAVRRTIHSSGFIIEKLPGPPGKREMMRGRK